MSRVDLNRLKEIFKTLISIYSPSKKEKDVCDYIADYLEKLGCEIYFDESYDQYGGNCPTLFALLKGKLEGPGVTLSAHMDVVEPNRNVQVMEEGDIIRTDGTTTLGGDDKAGIAVILYTLESLVQSQIDHEDIFCILTPGEEIGMLGAKSIDWETVYEKMQPAKNMIVLDNAGKSKYIAHQAPTCNNFEIEIHGKKAHAGIEPEKGKNAIQILSEIIANIKILRIDTLTTANISYICSDFPTNVVPDLAICKGEVRSHSYDTVDRVLKSYDEECRIVCEKYGVTYDLRATRAYPLLKSQDQLQFAKRFQEVYRKIGVDCELQVIGGGSDANFFAEEGFNAIIIGVGMQNVHTTSEYLEVKEMEVAANVLMEYFLNK